MKYQISYRILFTIVLTALIVVFRMNQPRWGTVRYQFEGKPEANATFPLVVRTEAKKLTVNTTKKNLVIYMKALGFFIEVLMRLFFFIYYYILYS